MFTAPLNLLKLTVGLTIALGFLFNAPVSVQALTTAAECATAAATDKTICESKCTTLMNDEKNVCDDIFGVFNAAKNTGCKTIAQQNLSSCQSLCGNRETITKNEICAFIEPLQYENLCGVSATFEDSCDLTCTVPFSGLDAQDYCRLIIDDPEGDWGDSKMDKCLTPILSWQRRCRDGCFTSVGYYEDACAEYQPEPEVTTETVDDFAPPTAEEIQQSSGTTSTNNQKTGLSAQYADIQNQGLIFAGICANKNADCACRDRGDCSLQDMLQVLVNISVFILGISGSILLLVIFYGGFLWITAHGNSTMIENGKKSIIGGVIGIVIILGSYVAVTLLISVIRTGNIPTSGTNLEDVIEGGSSVIKTE